MNGIRAKFDNVELYEILGISSEGLNIYMARK